MKIRHGHYYDSSDDANHFDKSSRWFFIAKIFSVLKGDLI